MRLGAYGIAALVLGAIAAHLLLQQNGYVLIGFPGWTVEMSVPMLVAVLGIAYALLRTAQKLWHAPRALSAAVEARRRRRAGERLTDALIQISEGHWQRGERLLARGLRGTDAPLVNYLAAARAAQLQGLPERRDEWLGRALEHAPAAGTAVLLTQAELQFEAGEYDAARRSLLRLRERQPQQPAMLGLLARTCDALGDRAALAALLPDLKTARLTAGQRESLAAAALDHALAGDDLTVARIDALWSELGPELGAAPALLRRRALALARVGHGARAEKELRRALARDWSAELVRTYGDVVGDDPLAQLRQAEKWLNARPEDAELLFATARLCMASELWGKARSYYESGLALAPRPDAYATYGALLERLGEHGDAARAYSAGLALVAPPLELPALTGPQPAPVPDIAKRA